MRSWGRGLGYCDHSEHCTLQYAGSRGHWMEIEELTWIFLSSLVALGAQSPVSVWTRFVRLKLDRECAFPLPVTCQEGHLKHLSKSCYIFLLFAFNALEIYHDFYLDIIFNNKTYLSLDWFIRHQLHAGPLSTPYRNYTSYYTSLRQ